VTFRIRLTPTERKWLGVDVRWSVMGTANTGQVFAQAPSPRSVWVTDGVTCWEVGIDRLERAT
jgi:hypothetical protein